MTQRRNFSSGAPWEDIVGYSRAVVWGDTLEMSGTVAVDDAGVVVGIGDVYTQARFIMQKIEKIMKQAGFSLEDVMRTRIYVLDISQWEEVGRAHGEFFGKIKPATSMVQVGGLIGPEYLVEIEVTARKR